MARRRPSSPVDEHRRAPQGIGERAQEEEEGEGVQEGSLQLISQPDSAMVAAVPTVGRPCAAPAYR